METIIIEMQTKPQRGSRHLLHHHHLKQSDAQHRTEQIPVTQILSIVLVGKIGNVKCISAVRLMMMMICMSHKDQIDFGMLFL